MYQILGGKPDVIDSEVQDRVGEITNMICGGAKNELDQKVMILEWLPLWLFQEKIIRLTTKSMGKKMVLPFSHALGNLYLEMCFNK
jgi:chemotaxis protein CheX